MYFDEYECPFLNYNNRGYRNDDMNIPARKAVAHIVGGPLAPNIRGTVVFTQVRGGTEVSAEVNGLPPYRPAMDGNP